MKHDSFAASSDAQAFAIGAVLIIAIVVTATTIYLAINQPIETKKCEFLHSTEVTDDFVALRSTINSLFHAESSVAYTSVPIKMTPTKESIIALPLASGSLSFSPTKGNIIVKLNETGTGNPGTWTINNFTGNYSVLYGNVVNVSGNITLEGPPYSSACIVSDMTNIFGHIGNDTGSNSTVYGNITWHAITSPPATEIIMKVRTSIFPNMTNATDWIEVENGENLSSRLPTLNGHQYVQFLSELKTWDPSQNSTLINVSIDYYSPPGGVVLAQSSGTITYKSGYHYLPNQVITYENGAVITSQKSHEERGFVVHSNENPVGFNISFPNGSGNRTRISISLVNLTGTNITHSGAPVELVRLLLVDRKLISDSLFYPNLTINVTSNNFLAIEEWFNKALANLTSARDYNVSVNDTAKTVSVEFYAKEHGVELYLEEAEVEVKI